MRSGVFFLLSFVSIPFSAMAVTYRVPTDGTFEAATTYANSYLGSEAVDINISGNAINSSSTVNIIKRSVDVSGIDDTATIAGSVAFTGGTTIVSSVNDLTFTGAPQVALVNGDGTGTSAGHTMTLNNVIFNANNNTSAINGGGVSNYGNLTIDGGAFTNNSENGLGGGLFNYLNTSISGTNFSNNTAAGGGGAIYNNGGTLNVNGASFDSNSTSGGTGGAINAQGAIVIDNSTFTNNTVSAPSGHGGAIAINSTYSPTLVITDSIFNGNNTTNTGTMGGDGGAIWLSGQTAADSAALTLVRGEFNNNAARRQGGAVAIAGSGKSHTITGTSFDSNSAATGAGGAIFANQNNLTLDSVTVKNNTAKGMGGGIYYYGLAGYVLTVKNGSIFDGNTGTDGGAIKHYAGGAVSISDTIIRNNTATTANGGGASVGGTVNIKNTNFINNHADAKYGGGLYTTSMNTQLDSVLFDGNTAANGGGAMNYVTSQAGTMTVGGNSAFRNNVAAEAGGAIFNLATVNLDTTKGGIVFENNSAQEGADIYNNSTSGLYGTVNIIGDANTLSMDGGIAGADTTIVNKTGKNDLVFLERADNTQFLGTFTQNAGRTTVYADNFFGGVNGIMDGSTLHFANSANVDTLNFETGGILDLRYKSNGLSRAAFTPNTLTVAGLSSDNTANIMMQTDGTTSDLLKITDTATGDFTLNFNAVGSSPTSEKILVVDLAEAATKDSNFISAGVDVGAWRYGLAHEADSNWYLEKTGELSGDAQNIGAIPAFHLSVVKTGMNELRKRMGALRNNNQNEETTGMWVRTYGKNIRIHENNGADMNLYGVEGGIDGMVNALGGKVYLGVMAGMMNTEDIKVKASDGIHGAGRGDAPSVGLYATWMENSNGSSRWFVDATVRHFWVHTDINRNDGMNGYDVKRNFFATSLEGGRLFYMESPDFMDIGSTQHSHISLEPKVELRYNRGNGQKFTMDDGINGTVDATESLSTHFNLQANYLPNGTASAWKPFVELGVYNEFAGKTEMRFGSEKMEASDTSGMGLEFTVGTNATISKDTYAYGALTAEVGKVYTSYLANIGIRVKF